ncbi:hypothetical protein [Cognatilysobacter lacus]|uniref:Transmembrane protein n=1 Tax=Cognatilysobacter lacus TaxID=1643323 RepID=A0A5D8Z756_9GAMM|nr:hypothetical protein [Lysobacter lacus]TZF90718.1 hypothetical protein FW784_04245 [Lysobacter lacus]
MSLLRLNVLRAFYAVMAFGLATVVWPAIVAPPADMSLSGSVVHGLLGGVGVMALVGIRYPLRMLPLLLFELIWKIIWVGAYVFPWWRSGHLPPGSLENLAQCVFGFVFIPLVLPWRYVIRQYVQAPGEPWRKAPVEQRYAA